MVDQLTAITEKQLRALLKQEIARLTDGRIAAEDIRDDEPLFSIPGECDSRIELDSLDALELSFALEEALGRQLPTDVGYEQLLTINAATDLVLTQSTNVGANEEETRI